VAFRSFCGSDLTDTLARAEAAVRGLTAERFDEALYSFGASHDALSGAGQLKRIVGQIMLLFTHWVFSCACQRFWKPVRLCKTCHSGLATQADHSIS
jgi:hypothetical protein